MKVLALLLALMTLLLSMTPCCSGESHCQEETARECAEHHEEDQQMPDAESPCSPFYTCGSCFGFVYQQVSFLASGLLPFTEQDFNSFYTENLSGSYLHPPKKPPIRI